MGMGVGWRTGRWDGKNGMMGFGETGRNGTVESDWLVWIGWNQVGLGRTELDGMGWDEGSLAPGTALVAYWAGPDRAGCVPSAAGPGCG